VQTPRESCLKNDGLFSALPDHEAGCRVHVSVETFTQLKLTTWVRSTGRSPLGSNLLIRSHILIVNPCDRLLRTSEHPSAIFWSAWQSPRQSVWITPDVLQCTKRSIVPRYKRPVGSVKHVQGQVDLII